MWFSLCLSVILLRSVSCVFTIKIGDWIGLVIYSWRWWHKNFITSQDDSSFTFIQTARVLQLVQRSEIVSGGSGISTECFFTGHRKTQKLNHIY